MKEWVIVSKTNSFMVIFILRIHIIIIRWHFLWVHTVTNEYNTVMLKVEKWKIMNGYRYKQSPYMWSGSCEARTGPSAMDTWETMVLLTSSLDLSGKSSCAMLIDRKINQVKAWLFSKVELTCFQSSQIFTHIFLVGGGGLRPGVFIERLISPL